MSILPSFIKTRLWQRRYNLSQRWWRWQTMADPVQIIMGHPVQIIMDYGRQWQTQSRLSSLHKEAGSPRVWLQHHTTHVVNSTEIMTVNNFYWQPHTVDNTYKTIISPQGTSVGVSEGSNRISDGNRNNESVLLSFWDITTRRTTDGSRQQMIANGPTLAMITYLAVKVEQQKINILIETINLVKQ